MERFKNRLLVANLVVMLMLVASSVAAHTGAVQSGVIHACQLLSKGTIRIIGDTGVCKTGESPLDWNAVGPQGPQGPAGADGATGPQGPSGVIATGYVNGGVGVLQNAEFYTFAGPTLNIQASSGQDIVVSGEIQLGSSGGGGPIELSLCKQDGTGLPFDNGFDWFEITIPAGERRVYSLSTVFKNNPAGSYKVGLCYRNLKDLFAGATWDNNEWARLSAMLVTASSGAGIASAPAIVPSEDYSQTR